MRLKLGTMIKTHENFVETLKPLAVEDNTIDGEAYRNMIQTVNEDIATLTSALAYISK